MKILYFVAVLCGYWISFARCFSDIQMSCFPVTESMCSGNVDNLLRKRNITPFHRKSTGKRNIQEPQLIEWTYNATVYPSFADDKSPADVKTSFSHLHPLIATKCSRYIKLFLCSVHSPACTPRGVVPPCRELCEQVKADCQSVAETFNLDWPEVSNCDVFPENNPVSECASVIKKQPLGGEEDDWTVVGRMSNVIWAESLLDYGQVCIPPSDAEVVQPALDRLNRCENKRNQTIPHRDFEITCPPELKSPPGHYGFKFMGLPNCSAPCPNMYLKNENLLTVRYFILTMAVLCILVTSFTLLTFAINTKRFRYPERPIVFYAFSYLVVSIVFLLGFIFRETAACHSKLVNENNEIVQGFVVVEGSGHRLCSTLFLVLYYFTVNGTIWWLILTITWLLAAGYKWGTEAIEERHLFYHAAAWGLPALQVLIVLVSNKIEGDNISGVCYVGLYDSKALHYFVLFPMAFYLLVGIIILFLGFFYLNRVRKKLDGDERNKEKLAKFMLRIGVFSILYIIPQIALIIIYAVEDSKRKDWESTWYMDSCKKNTFPCPASTQTVAVTAKNPQHPGVFLFCMKYMMTLIVALPPLFWVASRKTLTSWKLFFLRQHQPHPNHYTTRTHYLADTDGPHARDLQAKLHGKFSTQADAVFGDMCNSNLRGSSASVAAQMVSKRGMNTLQQQWEDWTDSDSSTYYSTSSLDSEMSRVLEHEARKNKGTRITGRKGALPPANKSHHHHSRPLDSRTSSINPRTSAKSPIAERSKLAKQNPQLKKENFAITQKPLTVAPGLSPNKIIPARTVPSNPLPDIGERPTYSQSLQKITLDSGSNKFLLVERSKSASPNRLSPLNCTPATSQVSSPCNALGEPRSRIPKEKSQKPQQAPPPPPPRIDSASASGKKTPERMLAI